MSAEVARILRDAADLIEPPGRWTTGAPARDASGNYVPSVHRDAVTWCGSGAIWRVAQSNWFLGSEAIERWAQQVDDWLVGRWNDSQPGPEPIVAALRAAADEAERS